ncbi:MAG: RagB/SusD family nutrient uptake outer membrane protein [Mucinivorans sp.]
MKKIIQYISLVVATFTLGSCNESYLNQMPTNALPSDMAILEYDDALIALNGVYDGMQRYTYYGAQMVAIAEVQGDYMQALDPNKRTSSFYAMSYNAQNAPFIWGVPYNQIRRANNLLKAIKAGKADKGAEPGQVDVIKGQVLALRALNHFDLVRLYGKSYSVDNGASLGVPIITEAINPDMQPSRATVAEVYKQVIADLKEATTLLASAKKETPSNGMLNLWAVKGLLARVSLYHGDNQAAFDLSEDIIANSPYKLLSNDDYVKAWAEGGVNTEMMFQVINNAIDNGDRESISYLMNEGGYSDMIISRKLVEILDANPGDVRRGLMIPSKISGNKEKFGSALIWLNKYPGKGTDPRINHVPVIRLSEIYLTAAEAAFKLGNMTAASTYLNAIAKRNPALGTLTPTLQSIMDQRGIELVGEGHRSFDLMRNGMTSDRSIRWSYAFAVPESISYGNTYFRAILPIPKSEVDANTEIAKQQNPGY